MMRLYRVETNLPNKPTYYLRAPARWSVFVDYAQHYPSESAARGALAIAGRYHRAAALRARIVPVSNMSDPRELPPEREGEAPGEVPMIEGGVASECPIEAASDWRGRL